MEQELSLSIKIVKKHPNLLWDYQLFIDQTSGAVYHLDFDRAFQKSNTTREYLEVTREYEWRLREMDMNLRMFVEEQGLTTTK